MQPLVDAHAHFDGFLDAAGFIGHNDELIERLRQLRLAAAVDDVKARDRYSRDRRGGEVFVEFLAVCGRRGAHARD
ncbi:hypothetical protein SDC9_206479 [bioreactor metagenome]|uniref:Uncharacterized protein n=1 Tax=bioreactor metagenome TaxID=1076179 RepID=A0A645J5N7_9ZZZZ